MLKYYFLVNGIATLILWVIPAVIALVRTNFSVDNHSRFWAVSILKEKLIEPIIADGDNITESALLILLLTGAGVVAITPVAIGYYTGIGIIKFTQWLWPKCLSRIFLSKEERAEIALGIRDKYNNEG